MFGPLIEKAQQLAKSILQLSESRARNRTRYLAAATIFAGARAASQMDWDDATVEKMMDASLKVARELEAKVYADADEEDLDFDL
jgi:hypothetical protein